MRYSFRLAQLIGHDPDPSKRPGNIKAIANYTGLDRHQVASLLRNDMKYIPLKALSRLCDFLVEQGFATADQLPGALFAIESENFWELLARRRRLELCVGVRRPEQQDYPEGAWIAASDSVLLGKVLNGVSTLGGTSKLQYPAEANGNPSPSKSSAPLPHPEALNQILVWSPGQGTPDEVALTAKNTYTGFTSTVGDKALLCLGSVKSNPVVERMVAAAFDCDPYISQDDVATAAERSCPFFLRYRDDDPQPESCCAGVRLSAKQAAKKPGIYYENAKGVWECIPWSERCDTALVFYVHREALGRLEMALSGFSGRATRMLAKVLSTQAESFWPPTIETRGLAIGAFVAKFTFPKEPDEPLNILRTDLEAETEIIPVPKEALQRRLGAAIESTEKKPA